MTPLFSYDLPVWMYQLVWSLMTILVIHLMGRFLARTVCRQLGRWAAQTAWRWDDFVIQAIQRGMPAWSVFFGCYVVLGFWDLTPQAIAPLHKMLFVFTLISVTLVIADLAGKLIVLYGKEIEQAMPVTSLTEQIARITIVALGLLTILHGLGISIAPLLTALGVGGLALALALQDTLSNMFAGFYLTVAGNLRVGDYVRLESGQEGYVHDIGWRETKLLMLPNNMVLVPNKKLSESIITNYYLPNRELAVLVEVTVDYGSDLARVERVASEVAKETLQATSGGIAAFEPLIRFHAFGESGVNFTVVMRAKEFADQYVIKHEFVKRLHARFRKEGILIPFPTRTVHVKHAAALGAS